jgi:inhibitor of the pro-sigma K processing machinery
MDIEIFIIVFIGIIFLLVLYGMFKFIIKTARDLIINAVGGLLIFLAANFIFNMGMQYNLINLLICIAGGIPGAIILIILHLLGINF